MSLPHRMSVPHRMRLRLVITSLTALALGACAGLPQKPQAVKLSTEAPLSEMPGDGSAWPEHDWWKRYHDPTLDQLIDMALSSSPSLATAHARFDSARQSVRIAGAQSGAHVDAVGDADRQRLSNNGVFSPRLLGFSWYNQFDLGLQASYTFDWWDKQKDAVQAAIDEAHAAQADRSAAALMLESSIADAYFGWQADESRLALAREREATVAQLGSISAARIHAELDPADDINHAESDLAAVRQLIASLEGSAQLHVVEIAALVGRSAAELPAFTAKPLPTIEQGLPDDVKLDLIARRADITASLWRVESAEKNRDSARAEFFPDITVNALLGVQSVDIGSLINYGSRVPQVTGAIHLPIFDAGRLKARYGASQSAIESAVSSYRETVVTAARDVATQVATRAQIVAERKQRLIEVEAAQRLTLSASARVKQGVTDPRPELDATATWIEQRDELLQLDAAAVSTDIGLQRALGGGYERKNETP